VSANTLDMKIDNKTDSYIRKQVFLFLHKFCALFSYSKVIMLRMVHLFADCPKQASWISGSRFPKITLLCQPLVYWFLCPFRHPSSRYYHSIYCYKYTNLANKAPNLFYRIIFTLLLFYNVRYYY